MRAGQCYVPELTSNRSGLVQVAACTVAEGQADWTLCRWIPLDGVWLASSDLDGSIDDKWILL